MKGFLTKHKKGLAITLSAIILLTAFFGGIAISESVYRNEEILNTSPSDDGAEYDWSQSDVFDVTRYPAITPKSGDGSVKILQLTDMHTMNSGTFASGIGMNYILDGLLFLQIERLVKKTSPDFVILTGDQITYPGAKRAYKYIAEKMEKLAVKYDFYWSFIFGNHDAEYSLNKYELAKTMTENSPRCLFDIGPTNLYFDSEKLDDPASFNEGKSFSGNVSLGNFVIKVLDKDGDVRQALIMMDSNDWAVEKDTNEDKLFSSPTAGYYPMQISWYDWVMEGLSKFGGTKPLPTSMYAHITPYRAPKENASDIQLRANSDAVTSWEYDGKTYDIIDSMVKCDSTKYVFYGHTHALGFSYFDEPSGILFTNGNKSGFNYNDATAKTGGTLIELSADGNAEIKCLYDDLVSIKELA